MVRQASVLSTARMDVAGKAPTPPFSISTGRIYHGELFPRVRHYTSLRPRMRFQFWSICLAA